MINVYIVDDHPLFVDGIRSIFEDKKDEISIIGYSYTTTNAIRDIPELSIDVIIIDVIMPEMSGLDLFLIVKQEHPQLKTLILTGYTDEGTIENFWRLGADAILAKHCGKIELSNAIHEIYNGKRILGQDVIMQMKGIKKPEFPGIPILSYRELQILNFLAKNYNRKSVASILGISKSTVDFHCRSIFKKFNKGNIHSIIEEARNASLISGII